MSTHKAQAELHLARAEALHADYLDISNTMNAATATHWNTMIMGALGMAQAHALLAQLEEAKP